MPLAKDLEQDWFQQLWIPLTQQQQFSQDARHQNNKKKIIKNDCLPTRPGMAIVLTDPVWKFIGRAGIKITRKNLLKMIALVARPSPNPFLKKAVFIDL